MRLIRLLKRDLGRETLDWVRQNIISEEQARNICRLYGVDYDKLGEGAGGLSLVVGLGYFFVGLATLVLIGYNWEEIPRALRMGGLLTLTMAAHAGAIWLYLQGQVRQATPLFFLGCFLYGVSIILIAQIYHLGEHMPDGILWWALGSLPFGLLLVHPRLTLFSLLVALIWMTVEAGMQYFPALFPLFLLAAIFILLRSPTHQSLYLTTCLAAVWWFTIFLSWLWADAVGTLHWYTGHVLVGLGLLVFAWAASLRLGVSEDLRARDYAASLGVWTLRIGLLVLFVLSFEAPWVGLFESDDWNYQGSLWALILTLLAVSLLFGFQAGARALQSVAALAAACLALSLTVVYLPYDPYTDTTIDATIVFQVGTNLVMIAAAAGLILAGARSGVSEYYNLGVLIILAIAAARYFQLVGASYVGAALLFFGLALVLFVAARLWSKYAPREDAA